MPPEQPAAPEPVDPASTSSEPATEQPGAGRATSDEPHEDPALIEAQREEARRKRGRQTARDMIISMVVVAGAVLLIWLPTRPSPPSDTVKVVDPAPVIQGARQAETWPVLAPVGLPAGWRCTSARIEQAADGQDVVHLGYLSPTQTYVGLEQSATKATSFVYDASVGGREKGAAEVAGQQWTTYENEAGDHRALVRAADGATYVVVGTGPYDQLEEFASRLRA